jgi:tRNA pseudouridine55 synthase
MFYVVKKPLGISSNLVAKILKRVLRVDKMGFAGTLDPLATGLMIIGTDGSPRLFPMIEHFSKTYTATIRLDGTTDSYDLEQPIVPVDVDKEIISTLSKGKIEKIIEENFIGTISQFPPNYSAVWINGKRAYDLARKGHEIEMKAKQRVIEKFEILSYTWPTLKVEITVSHGTYIRSLARDLGIKLGTGGYLEKLERISLGHISLDKVTTWIQHNDIYYAPLAHETLFPDIPVLPLSTEEKTYLRLGSTPIPTEQKNGHYFVAYDDSYGLMEAKEGLLFPIKN